MQTETKKRPLGLSRGDIFIYLLLCVIALILFFARAFSFSHDTDKSTLYVCVVTDTTVERYALSEVREWTVQSGGHTLKISIADGAVSVTESDCPDRICAAAAPISEPGASIVCLPAHVVISIEGRDDDADMVLG